MIGLHEYAIPLTALAITRLTQLRSQSRIRPDTLWYSRMQPYGREKK